MTMKNAAKTLLPMALCAAFLLVFDVSFNPQLSFAHDEQVADPAQEELYRQCYEARDAEIHARAFDTIDNPDVQREFISMHREQARADCRQLYPERSIAEHESFRFNLVDLRFRFRG